MTNEERMKFVREAIDSDASWADLDVPDDLVRKIVDQWEADLQDAATTRTS